MTMKLLLRRKPSAFFSPFFRLTAVFIFASFDDGFSAEAALLATTDVVCYAVVHNMHLRYSEPHYCRLVLVA